MTMAALAIGVNRTGGQLPPLDGAARGARDFGDWAAAQGMNVTVITDDKDHEVTLTKLQDAVEALKPRNCQKLIVYFSGHGFLLSPHVELWLLSKAPDRATEAVNVQLSREFARYCGSQHVIFISDACRSGGRTHEHRSVTGGPIFPTPSNYRYEGTVDTFYATRPGDVALEYEDKNEAAGNYKGIFTECLLEALKGKEPKVVHELTEGSRPRWLVLSHLLKPHLYRAVPRKAQSISIKLSQSPLVISESHLPLFFGELDWPPAAAVRGAEPAPPSAPDVGELVSAVQDEVMSFAPVTDAVAREATTDAQRLFAQQVDLLATSRGRGHFETHTGFSFYHPVRAAVAGDGLLVEIVEDPPVTHLRVYDPDDGQGRSILVQFESGFGTVLAIKPGFIGTVMFEDDQVVNVNYTPSDNTELFWNDYEPEADRIERRRAFAASAARHGVFELDSEKAEHAGDYLRMLKGLDPTLGIYAAYAYFQAGRMGQVRDVLSYMVKDPPPVPFDVALLARFPEDMIDPQTPVAPFCPMLSQGWALLELHPPASDRLWEYRYELRPSLWTKFSPEGVRRVREALEKGELR